MHPRNINEIKTKGVTLKSNEFQENILLGGSHNGGKIHAHDLNFKNSLQKLNFEEINDHRDNIIGNSSITPNNNTIHKNLNSSYIDTNEKKSRFKIIANETQNLKSTSKTPQNKFPSQQKDRNEKYQAAEDNNAQRATKENLIKPTNMQNELPISIPTKTNSALINDNKQRVNKMFAKAQHVLDSSSQCSNSNSSNEESYDIEIPTNLDILNKDRKGGAIMNLKQRNDPLLEHQNRAQDLANDQERIRHIQHKQQSSRGNFNRATTKILRGSTMTNEEVKYHYFDVQKPSENNKRQYSPSLCLQQSTKHDHDKSVEQMKEIGCMYQESESHSALSRTEVHLLNNGQIAQGLITKEINNRLKQVQIKTPSDKKQNDDQKSGINSHSANPQICSSQMQSRYFDGARSYQTDHVRPFELKNEPAPVYQDYELNPKFYMMNRNLNNQPSYGNNQLADPRSFDQLRMMSEMMCSMMAVQQNNFQIMISSHTQLMTKLIEKSGRHKRRHYCHSKSSKYES